MVDPISTSRPDPDIPPIESGRIASLDVVISYRWTVTCLDVLIKRVSERFS